MRSLRLLGVCLVMLLLVGLQPGCSRPSSPVFVKVSGKVVDAQGKPIPSLNIHFLPTENLESFRVGKHVLNYPIAIGNKDGTFALTMSGGDIDGARPGKYRVVFMGVSNQKIPSKYQDGDNSPLNITIPNKDVSDLTLKIE